MGKVAWWIERAKDLRKSYGLSGLLRRTISYTLEPVFWRKTINLYEHAILERGGLNESDYKPAIDDFVFKVVASHAEADKLEAEGFMFRTYPTFDNTRLRYYRKLLDQGAIAFCGFYKYNKDLATIHWIIPSEQAIHKVSPYRMKVDYAAGETYLQGSWTNSTYRGKGIYKYNILFVRDPYLIERGVKIVRTGVWDQNLVTNHVVLSLGARLYAKAHLTKILFSKFWEKEVSLRPSEYQKLNPTNPRVSPSASA